MLLLQQEEGLIISFSSFYPPKYSTNKFNFTISCATKQDFFTLIKEIKKYTMDYIENNGIIEMSQDSVKEKNNGGSQIT